MNPTKNVRCIEVAEDLFELLYEAKYDEKVKQIQAKYQELEQRLPNRIFRWMKLKDADVYLDTENRVLIPDTRKMKATDLRIQHSASYQEKVNYIDNCSPEELEKIKLNAEKDNMVIPSKPEAEIMGYEATPLSLNLAMSLFGDGTCPCTNESGYFETIDGTECACVIVLHPTTPIYSAVTKNVFRCDQAYGALNLSVHQFKEDMKPFELLVKYGLYPVAFREEENGMIAEFHKIAKDGIDIKDFNALKSYLQNGHTSNIVGIDLRKEAIENDIEAEEIDLSADMGSGFILRNYYDECDYIRAKIQKYNSRWYLSDDGRGHWDIWGRLAQEVKSEEKIDDEKADGEASPVRRRVLRLKECAIARNPVADVKHDAVVGIDFGTKSTIVALQDGDEQIIPLRVGMADYSAVPEVSHYENPTVMQFIDLSHFEGQYSKMSGRPMTFWDDLKISHEAFENMIGAEESTAIASFISDIKQWAGGKYAHQNGGHLIIKDAKGYRYDIENYMELAEEDIDLIEIYAYYIGLFINNMHMGIHLDYILSFPETFSREIREHLLTSFTKGIRKSIPSTIFEDEDCASEFRVRQGVSEPAAYAACALEQYGIEPTDEGIFYGIFDFGGGTTDYDYGIWKNAPEDELTYNYVIKHYGSGGDKTLGGENILQLLSYNVFSADGNLDIMREKNLTFYRPEEGCIVSGAEGLNNSSESAMLNTKLMMEALRPIWEEWEEVAEWFSDEKKRTSVVIQVGTQNVSLILEADSTIVVELPLFSDQGREKVVLNVDMAMVNETINNRIESGVRNFFEGLVLAYKKSGIEENEKIHLFLAGNSSKSQRVWHFFEYYVLNYNEILFGEEVSLGEAEPEYAAQDTVAEKAFETMTYSHDESEKVAKMNQLNSLENCQFIVFPPLGTGMARNIQQSRGIDIKENDLMSPTGKTGVAFGLVMCREGSMIKVESETRKSEQIKFNYYIGVNYRKNFKMIFDRNSGYNKWMKFTRIPAEAETFEFYYTELPEVVEHNIPIKDNKAIYKRKCMVDHVTMDAFVFFKFVSPTQLEYVVATEENVELGEYISKVYKVSL